MGYRLDEFDLTPGVIDGSERAREACIEVAKRWNDDAPDMNAELLQSAITGTDKIFVLSSHETYEAALKQWRDFWKSEWAKDFVERWRQSNKDAGISPLAGYRHNWFYKLPME